MTATADDPVPDDAGVSGWGQFHKRFHVLGLPQVPDAQVGERFAEVVGPHDARVLLLGVTRVLAGIGADLTVVDWSPDQIERLWPGDGPRRRALLADWREMELPRAGFTAAIGDGSLSALSWPNDYAAALGHVADALVPGGRLVLRCFVAPDEPETLDQVRRDVLALRETSYNAARWRVAMALAGSRGNVIVGDIHDAFRSLFPDWRALAERTGWDLAAIELILGSFRDSPLVFSFVTREALLESLRGRFSAARFVPSGDYPLAERCPFLVAERAE